mmetsp:Transcript_30902/g.90331  ORF Transcript_30902/g.90331 Transcript_30902/m.90331 type:complete len:234 (-) Transcript_30902:1538-2239(-)
MASTPPPDSSARFVGLPTRTNRRPVTLEKDLPSPLRAGRMGGCRPASSSRRPVRALPISSHPSPMPCATAYPSSSSAGRPPPLPPRRPSNPVRPSTSPVPSPSGRTRSRRRPRSRSSWTTPSTWPGTAVPDPSSSICPRICRTRSLPTISLPTLPPVWETCRPMPPRTATAVLLPRRPRRPTSTLRSSVCPPTPDPTGGDTTPSTSARPTRAWPLTSSMLPTVPPGRRPSVRP